MSLVRYSGWDFVTSGGGELTFGLSRFLFAGGHGGALYVRQSGQQTIHRLPYVGFGGGVGVGVSAGGPVSVSVSLPFQPGGGFRIYRHPLRGGSLALDDFVGNYVAYSGSGSLLGAVSGTLIFIGAPAWLVALANNPALPGVQALSPLTAIAACQGVGVLWGTAETSGAGVGLTVYHGQVIGHSIAAPGETG